MTDINPSQISMPLVIPTNNNHLLKSFSSMLALEIALEKEKSKILEQDLQNQQKKSKELEACISMLLMINNSIMRSSQNSQSILGISLESPVTIAIPSVSLGVIIKSPMSKGKSIIKKNKNHVKIDTEKKQKSLV